MYGKIYKVNEGVGGLECETSGGDGLQKKTMKIERRALDIGWG
jgi:hypothetical protein